MGIALVGCGDVAAPGDFEPSSQLQARCGSDEPFELIVADRGGNAIRRYDGVIGAPLSSITEGADGWGGALDRPVDVAVGPDDALYVANFGPSSVLRLASDGTAERFYFDSFVLEEPIAVQWHDDTLLVLGNDSGNLVKLAADGALQSEFGHEELRFPLDMVVGEDGVAKVIVQPGPGDTDTIQEWDVRSEERVTSWGAPESLVAPQGIASDCIERTFISTGAQAWSLLRIEGSSSEPVDAIVETPGRLDVGPDGRVYISSPIGIHRYDPSTHAVELFIPTGRGGLVDPRGMAFR